MQREYWRKIIVFSGVIAFNWNIPDLDLFVLNSKERHPAANRQCSDVPMNRGKMPLLRGWF